jgi:hypothetical protein
VPPHTTSTTTSMRGRLSPRVRSWLITPINRRPDAASECQTRCCHYHLERRVFQRQPVRWYTHNAEGGHRVVQPILRSQYPLCIRSGLVSPGENSHCP